MLSADFSAVLASLRAQASAWVSSGMAVRQPLRVETPLRERGGIVLRGEAQCDLGEADVATACCMAIDADPAPGAVDAVGVRGPALSRVPSGSSLPFGVALVVGGPLLEDADYERACDAVRGGGRLEGCMARGREGELWLRPSKKAVRAGLDLPAVGDALAAAVRQRIPHARYVHVYLLAGDAAAVEALRPASQAAREVGHILKKAAWAERGVDIDCPSGFGHCGSCDDREACAAVRRIAQMRDEEKGS